MTVVFGVAGDSRYHLFEDCDELPADATIYEWTEASASTSGYDVCDICEERLENLPEPDSGSATVVGW